MSYKSYVVKRAPISSWILDDTVPFQEITGFNAAAGKKSGSGDPTKAAPLVAGAAWSSVFKSGSVGEFTCPLFKRGLESRPFVLEVWLYPIRKTTTAPQQILSHDGVYDGLTINGNIIKFSTQYATYGEAACEYDLQTLKAAHVVAIHNADQNQLWVNGTMVASVDITENQKADVYASTATTGLLYAGATTSNQEIAMNGVAFYPSLSGDQIVQNYFAGVGVVPQPSIYPQFDGASFNLSRYSGSVFLRETWANMSDFNRGVKTNVEYSSTKVTPLYNSSGVSLAGSWKVSCPLDGEDDTSIYGVMISWSGQSIDVDVSVDGTTWSQAYNGELVSVISNGYNPSGKDIMVRVSFAGGLTDDPAYLESLTLIGFRNNNFDNSASRSVSATHPSVLREDYAPITYRDDNGINLHGATLTIGADTSAEPTVARTLEMWIKPLSGTPTISIGGTKYRNGAADTTLPIGEWSLIHYVSASDVTGSVTVSGDCIVGQVTLYPTALTANDIDHIFKSYTGIPTIRINDTNAVSISEVATPASIYAHDWSISGAG